MCWWQDFDVGDKSRQQHRELGTNIKYHSPTTHSGVLCDPIGILATCRKMSLRRFWVKISHEKIMNKWLKDVKTGVSSGKITWLILDEKQKWICSIFGHFKEKCKCRHMTKSSSTCFSGRSMVPPVVSSFPVILQNSRTNTRVLLIQ